MCEFCDYYYSTKGGVSGKSIKINKCANETDLTDCTVVAAKNDKPCIVIFSNGMAKGYFEVAHCPICGRKLTDDEEFKSTEELLEEFKDRFTSEELEEIKELSGVLGRDFGKLWNKIVGCNHNSEETEQ